MKFAAIFSIIVGMGMITQWAMSYLSNQIPELKTEPIRIRFHLAAEIATALALALSGVMLLLGANLGKETYLIATGMLLYTAIVSPGYFAQKGAWIWVLIFVMLIALALIGVTRVV